MGNRIAEHPPRCFASSSAL